MRLQGCAVVKFILDHHEKLRWGQSVPALSIQGFSQLCIIQSSMRDSCGIGALRRPCLATTHFAKHFLIRIVATCLCFRGVGALILRRQTQMYLSSDSDMDVQPGQ